MTLSPEIVIGIVGALLASLVGAIGVLFRLVIKNYDDRIKAMESRALTLDSMLTQAVFVGEQLADKKATATGEPLPPVLPPVIPFKNSPLTPAQWWAARLETHKAKLARIYKAAALAPVGLEMDEDEK